MCWYPPRFSAPLLYNSHSHFPPTSPFLHADQVNQSLTHNFLDYCIVAFFIVIVISVIQWFIDGRKNYKGPVVELVGEDEPVYASDNLDDKAGRSNGADLAGN